MARENGGRERGQEKRQETVDGIEQDEQRRNDNPGEKKRAMKEANVGTQLYKEPQRNGFCNKLLFRIKLCA